VKHNITVVNIMRGKYGVVRTEPDFFMRLLESSRGPRIRGGASNSRPFKRQKNWLLFKIRTKRHFL